MAGTPYATVPERFSLRKSQPELPEPAMGGPTWRYSVGSDPLTGQRKPGKLVVLLVAGALLAGCTTAQAQPKAAEAKAPVEPACSTGHQHGGPAQPTKPAGVYKVPSPQTDGSRVGFPCQQVGLVNAPGAIQGFLEQRTDRAGQLTVEEAGRTYASVMAEQKSDAPSRLVVTFVGHEAGKILVEYVVEEAADPSQLSRFDPAATVMFMNPDKLEVVYREARQ